MSDDVPRSTVQRVPGKVVYLPPADTSRWIASPDLVSQAGIEVILDPWQLAVEGGDATAVFVDKDWWSDATRWLTTQKDKGVIIIGRA